MPCWPASSATTRPARRCAADRGTAVDRSRAGRGAEPADDLQDPVHRRRPALLRLDEETTAALDEATAAALLHASSAALPDTDVVILSDYAKGVLCDSVLEAAGADRGPWQTGHRRPQTARFPRLPRRDRADPERARGARRHPYRRRCTMPRPIAPAVSLWKPPAARRCWSSARSKG